MKAVIPVVGMGATLIGFSDRHAATVVEVINRSTVVVRRDKATRTDKNGMSERQEYTYEPDEEAATEVYTLRDNGAWVKRGTAKRNGPRLRLGERDEHHDYSF